MEVSEQNCRSRINVGNEIKSEHCHEPQPEKVEEKLFRAKFETGAICKWQTP